MAFALFTLVCGPGSKVLMQQQQVRCEKLLALSEPQHDRRLSARRHEGNKRST